MDTTTCIAHAFHLAEWQKRHQMKNNLLKNSLILANMLCANKIENVDLKIGCIVGYFRSDRIPLPIMIPHVWVVASDHVVECNISTMDIEEITYHQSFKDANERFSRLVEMCVGNKNLSEIKNTIVSEMVKLNKKYKDGNYTLDEKDPYFLKYVKHCEKDRQLTPIK